MDEHNMKLMKIKTGIVKRLAKEKVMYDKEAEQQRVRIQKYKSEGRDDHDIRKQEEVLQESLMMVPDCQRRLFKAFEELRVFLERVPSNLKETEDFTLATKVLEDAKAELPAPGQSIQHFC